MSFLGDGVALAEGGPVALVLKKARDFWASIPWQAKVAMLAILICWAWGHWRYGIGWHSGRDSRNREVAQLVQQRDIARGNAGRLDAALARQNKALADGRAAAITLQKAAGDALAHAAKADARAASDRARADALAARKPAGICLSPEGDKLSEDLWPKL